MSFSTIQPFRYSAPTDKEPSNAIVLTEQLLSIPACADSSYHKISGRLQLLHLSKYQAPKPQIVDESCFSWREMNLQNSSCIDKDSHSMSLPARPKAYDCLFSEQAVPSLFLQACLHPHWQRSTVLSPKPNPSCRECPGPTPTPPGAPPDVARIKCFWQPWAFFSSPFTNPLTVGLFAFSVSLSLHQFLEVLFIWFHIYEVHTLLLFAQGAAAGS